MNERIKLERIEDLDKYNLVILNKEKLIKNNLKQILDEKGLNQSDLSELTGICRQNISEIVNDKMIPGVILASQIAFVLNKKIEDIFELTDNAWVRIAKINKDTTMYIDLYNLEVISNTIRKKQISVDDLQYIDLKNNKCITSVEYDRKLKEFLSKEADDNGKIKWKNKKALLESFGKLYSERYKKLGERIIPFNINK